MNNADVLILNGAPGSGKSTLAEAISELLRKSNITHAVIDLDELARVYPNDIDTLNDLKWRNLAAVWPNYTASNKIKIIIPVLIDTTSDLKSLRDATPAESFTICVLSAPTDILKSRVTAREPNNYWQERLRNLVDNYSKRSEHEKFGDFQMSTHDKSIEETAQAITNRLGWESAN